MPELPEVETVRKCLEQQIKGRKILQCQKFRDDLRIPFPDNLIDVCSNSKVNNIMRRSKYLLFDIEKDDYLVIHLGMSGKITFGDVDYERVKHDHLIFNLEGGGKMIFNDPRRFGLVTLVNRRNFSQHKLFSGLGAEPFDQDFGGNYLKNIFKNKTQPIKLALMDSRNLVGVGNIYAAESLFRSGINPKIAAGNISLKRLEVLAGNIRQVLSEAIESGGSTLRDYVRSDGDIGYFQHKFKVYGRENQACEICGTLIKRIVQQNRSTFYCPNCQKR